MTKQDLMDRGFEDFVVFENPDFEGCIVGITTDNQVVYSLAQMVDWFVKEEGGTKSEALQFIECNTIRALPYVENSPIILNDL